FLFDPNNARGFDDYRARVHDSHGLLALSGWGEWIWRPLHNGPGLRVTQLRDTDPRGFGLVQRERAFESYLDLEARYDRRPSEWVEVVDGDWGSGGVELLEIPTESEFNDNIVAYWVPDVPFRAGDARSYRYRLVTFDDRLPQQDVARVARTRIGWDALPGQADPPPRSHRRFVVDFIGGTTRPGELDGDSLRVSLTSSAGTVEGSRVEPLPGDQGDEGWRVTFELRPDGDRPSDMRLHLDAGERRLTETWSYVWYPEQGRR
ncbi:MAG: glucan biosynthesis protein, partial [Longimicrobiales bacterium]